jgi:hypothetical protein
MAEGYRGDRAFAWGRNGACPREYGLSGRIGLNAPVRGKYRYMILLLVLLVVLIFAGAGFALHVLWIAAVIFAIFWLIGLALGRHRFYRW